MKIQRLIPIFVFVIFLCGCTERQDEYSETQFLMDTVCTIRSGGDNAKDGVIAAFDMISKIERLTDYYSEASEVTAINNSEINNEIIVSEHMGKILSAALDVAEKSEGAFDITMAPLKDLWRFSDGAHKPPDEDEISDTLENVGCDRLKYDKQNNTLIKTAECKIDLGGAAKGYAADCAAEVLKKYGCKYALIDLGGNIYVYGKNPSRYDGQWQVGIQKPFAKNGKCSDFIKLSEGAVVTAGSYQRYFEWEGKLYHHILNPETGYPSNNGIHGASIKSGSALYADCLSTACMVLPKEKREELVSKFDAELIVEE